MEIRGKVYLTFEQSGVFRDVFRELGYEAYTADIQNNFGKTDFQIDLFEAIENAYNWNPSFYDMITPDDLVFSFFPCIFFCQASMSAFCYTYNNYSKMDVRQKTDAILERSKNREYFYSLLIKLFCIVQERSLRMIVENPYSGQHYLVLPQNFVMPPTFIDHDRTRRGDYFKKPTAYWFVNCEPTHGETLRSPKERKTVFTAKIASRAGLCSEERSLISPEYARNFILDFVLGKETIGSQLQLDF